MGALVISEALMASPKTAADKSDAKRNKERFFINVLMLFYYTQF